MEALLEAKKKVVETLTGDEEEEVKDLRPRVELELETVSEALGEYEKFDDQVITSLKVGHLPERLRFRRELAAAEKRVNETEEALQAVLNDPYDSQLPSYVERAEDAVDHALKDLREATMQYDLYAFGNEGAAMLGECLKAKGELLESLCLAQCEIQFYGVQALSPFVAEAPSLRSLDLRKNPIGEEGGAALADALKANTTLTSLNLHGCMMETSGSVAVLEALGEHPSIEHLKLRNNHLHVRGGEAAAELVKRSETLLELDLSTNNIGMDGAAAIAEALAYNTTLQVLDLHYNDLEYEIRMPQNRKVHLAFRVGRVVGVW